MIQYLNVAIIEPSTTATVFRRERLLPRSPTSSTHTKLRENEAQYVNRYTNSFRYCFKRATTIVVDVFFQLLLFLFLTATIKDRTNHVGATTEAQDPR
jgi:hypothetical protein